MNTVNLNKPIDWGTFNSLSKDTQAMYLEHLVNDLHARRIDLQEMFGISNNIWYKFAPTLPTKLVFKCRDSKPSPEWLSFINASTQPTSLEPEPVEDIIHTDTPSTPSPFITPVFPVSGSLFFNGTPEQMYSMLKRITDQDRQYRFTVSFE